MIRLSRWGLGTLAVALAMTAPASAAEVDKLLPANSEGAVYINVRQVVESDLVKKYALEQMKQALAGADAQKVLGVLGLDPLKDLDKVIIGGYGDDPANTNVLFIVRGRFDPDKLYAGAQLAAKKEPEKISIVKEGDSQLLKINVDNVPNPIYGTVVDKGTLVFGTQKDLVMEAVAGGSKKGVKPELAALITKIDEKTSISAVAVVNGKLGNAQLPGINDPAIQKNLEKTDNIVLTVNVTSDVSIELGFGMKDADSADDFGKLVDQGIQQAKGFLPLLGGDPRMKPLIELGKTLGSSVKDKQVIVSAKLTGDAIGKLINPE